MTPLRTDEFVTILGRGKVGFPIMRNIRSLSRRIAESLFTNGSGKRAERLQLMSVDKQNLGGWAELVVADRIEMAIRSEIKEQRRRASSRGKG